MKKVKVFLTHEQTILVNMLLSREIIEYRKNPYEGVRLYTQNCREIRRKMKDGLEKFDAVSKK